MYAKQWEQCSWNQYSFTLICKQVLLNDLPCFIYLLYDRTSSEICSNMTHTYQLLLSFLCFCKFGEASMYTNVNKIVIMCTYTCSFDKCLKWYLENTHKYTCTLLSLSLYRYRSIFKFSSSLNIMFNDNMTIYSELMTFFYKLLKSLRFKF